MANRAPIFVLDSGIGGLSILKELLTLAPNRDYLYLADQAYFPYGDKDPQWVLDRLVALVEYGVSQKACAIVIACNTATVHSIKELRAHYKLPIFGVEPVVKPLVQYQNAAILATSGTAKSARTQALAAESVGYHVRVVGAPGLAAAIENMDQAEVVSILTRLNSQLQGLQALGLSCTHYPLAKTAIAHVFPGVALVDPSLAVATHVIASLPQSTIHDPRSTYLTTGDVLRLKEQLNYYLGLSVEGQKVII